MTTPINCMTFFIKNFIDDWVSKRILLHHAKINLKIDQDEYDKKVNDYKNSLIIYNYEQQLVEQNLGRPWLDRRHDYHRCQFPDLTLPPLLH